MVPRLLIICGTSGVGKSTMSASLASSLSFGKIASTDTIRNITWAATGGNNIRKDNNFPTATQVQLTTTAKIFDFWTSDAGTTVYARYIGEYS